MKRIKLILILMACLLLITTTGLAMGSTNYTLNWYHPLTGSGGPSTSTHYAINVTVGQSVTGPSTSTNYKMGLGYWAGLPGEYKTLAPVVFR
jgi:hypothetical protein